MTTRGPDLIQQRAAAQQQKADAALAAAAPAVQDDAPSIYGPGGTERPRLLTDIVTAVATPGATPEQITDKAQALIDWIDAHD